MDESSTNSKQGKIKALISRVRFRIFIIIFCLPLFISVLTTTFAQESSPVPDVTAEITPEANEDLPAPVASFDIVDLGNGLIGFTDTSIGTVERWAWSFGDTLGSSTEQNPQYQYTRSGDYEVFLTVEGAGQFSVASRTITITFPLQAAFSTTVIGTEPPFTVEFLDQTEGIVETYLWQFHDGTENNVANPTKVYDGIGTYSVSLTVTGPGGTSTADGSVVISGSGSVPLFVSFEAFPAIGPAPLTVNFTETANGEDTYSWDFNGDGAVDSTEPNPIYTF